MMNVDPEAAVREPAGGLALGPAVFSPHLLFDRAGVPRRTGDRPRRSFSSPAPRRWPGDPGRGRSEAARFSAFSMTRWPTARWGTT